ncbi:MAG: hypothetical protein Rsou_0458 [Candidatus Ruthia sp. Asou_11_S2]|nr:hypothetical protein [Candidatus Ruthia sp. Asou_11_S2]
MDIFSTREDFHKVNKVLLDFSKKYNNVFSIKTIEEVKNFRIRMEKYNQLYYQLDNSVNDEELPTFL